MAGEIIGRIRLAFHPHFSSVCLERVHAALVAANANVARLEAALASVNRESASDKALVRRITEICPDCPAEGGCERCEGSGVVPVDPAAEEALERAAFERDDALEEANLLRGAVDWYADRENYSKTSGAPYNNGLDQGRVARQALALARLVQSGVPLDHCELCGASRQAWQAPEDENCPNRSLRAQPCDGRLVATAKPADADAGSPEHRYDP